jgi:hypothetical protein
MKIFQMSMLAALAAMANEAAAGICPASMPAKKVGRLDTSIINEASGLALSRSYPDRLYHINDSGDGPNLYVTKPDGSQTKIIEIANFSPEDTEDLTIGHLGSESNDTIIIGDIGDNRRARTSIKIVVLDEPATIASSITPRAVIELKYPDGPHNAEGMALHPNGDLYILTKESNGSRTQERPAQLYRLKRDQIQSGSTKIKILEKVGEIDIPKILADRHPIEQIVTSFAISPDGTRILILTYSDILEVEMNLAVEVLPVEHWQPGVNYRRILASELPQQEAIAYGLNSSDILFTSESPDSASESPIQMISCVLPR